MFFAVIYQKCWSFQNIAAFQAKIRSTHGAETFTECKVPINFSDICGGKNVEGCNHLVFLYVRSSEEKIYSRYK